MDASTATIMILSVINVFILTELFAEKRHSASLAKRLSDEQDRRNERILRLERAEAINTKIYFKINGLRRVK